MTYSNDTVTPLFRNIQKEISLISQNIDRENDKILKILNESNMVADKKIEYIQRLMDASDALSHRLEEEIISLEHTLIGAGDQAMYDEYF